ncbi:UNVERIFIED_CONTAM: protein PIN-LIKES 6 [Sesamum radiatum]|uniref:Protein PIN-LIKES 6 n=1 Tax=Sesamum radiatum TaxID=300843 RepID=A0AAW2R5J1_SESRA
MMDRMQRLLFQVLTEPQRGGESLLGTIKIAVLPIAKVFTMCFLGFLMASKYVNILPANGRKLLNGLVFSLLLPCLIFSQLGQAITFQKMIEWWFIPFNVVLATISGSIIGLIVASIVRPPYPYFKFTIIQIGIGNIGNVPLVLIAALCRDKSNPFGDFNKCSQDGNAYISFGQWVGAIVLYTYVFHMLAPPPGGTFDVEDGNLPVKNPMRNSFNALAKDNSPEQLPLLVEEAIPAHLSVTKKEKIKAFLKYIYEKLKLKQILQPPIIASLFVLNDWRFAFFLANSFLGDPCNVNRMCSFLKKLVFTSDAPLYFFTDSCMILGEAMIPCILLALGGNLVDGPGSSKLGARTTAAIILETALGSSTGLGIVMLADKLGFLPPDDKMFRFVLLLQHTMPTSVLSGAVASLRGCGREAAAVLFWVHIFAVFSMAGWIILYLNILF